MLILYSNKLRIFKTNVNLNMPVLRTKANELTFFHNNKLGNTKNWN